MLEEPQNISDADAESIRILTETYPYFAPARYMQAAQQHKTEPFTPEMMSNMQLFSGNWLLYSEYLQAALSGEEVEYNTPVVKEARRKQPQPVFEEEELEEELDEEIADIQEEQEALSPTQIHKERTTPVTGKENFADDFVPENTGFIRGKKSATPPPADEPEEDMIETHIPDAVAEDLPPVKMNARETAAFNRKADWDDKSENLIPPIYTEDYFLHQGMHVSNDIPEDIGKAEHHLDIHGQEKSLMVVMSFAEWLMFYKKKKQQEQEEVKDQRELKTMWQKEKLAAALEEENEEIPENVFEMAVNSITKEENLISESLAEVLLKQGRYDRAIEMYKKLSLRKPQKKAYFARKIEEILKEK